MATMSRTADNNVELKREGTQGAFAPGVFATAQRVIIEGIEPVVEGGRHPAKRVVGDTVRVEVDLVADSHDLLGGRLWYRRADDADKWQAVPLSPLVNDRYYAEFEVDALGRWAFALEAWVDEPATWQRDLRRKIDGAEEADVISHLRFGSRILEAVAKHAPD